MSQKRQQEDARVRSEGSTTPEDKRRRFPSVLTEVMKLQHLLEPTLEPLIRRVVKEEVELALRKHLNNMTRNCGEEIHASESRSLKLQFASSLSLPVFTGTRIEGEECSTMKVALVDAVTGHIVDFGPEASVKVEIVVLEGDFDGDEEDNWTLEEFKNNIVRERDGKKPLLTGDVFLNLKEGIGFVGEISFTDNSSWTRSRKFRLGARVVDYSNGTRIREAKTESFIVRDHRGELYKKHHPPSLLDEVWRLEKIGKDGAFHKRLSRENINTVKDFLTLLFLDPSRLRNILGTGMSAKMWEVTVDHARTCMVDKRLYVYHPLNSQQKSSVVFNIVGQVMGLLSESQFVPIDKLSETEKADAQNLVLLAFEHWAEVVSYDDETSILSSTSNTSNVLYRSGSPGMESSNGTKLLTSPKIGRFDYTQPVVSSPDIVSSIYSIGCGSSLDDYPLHGIGSLDLGYDNHPLGFTGQVANSLICDTESMTQAFCDDHLQFLEADCSLQCQTPSLESQADLQSAVNGFLYSRSTAVAHAQRRWRKLFNVLRWFSIRKAVNSRKQKNRVQEMHRYNLEALQKMI
ncbi:calmodulin-binding protein 60 A [Malania oleifera]|uniref:calmodulin-binding protein 60 A n=1 Tax=Malania oleifera TaxID=397392 RepID=UPI0025ADD5BB|nr:calmodulin-binding protein 60 A [Malania oleifera]